MDAITTTTNQALVFEVRDQPLDHNPAAVYLSGLKPSGRYTQAQALNQVARLLNTPEMRDERGKENTYLYCPWAALRFQHVAAIKSQLEGKYKPATVNKALAAVRGVLFAAKHLKQISAEDFQDAREVKGITNHTLPAGRELAAGEISALMAACENDLTPAGARDAAIVAVAYSCGLRRQELAGLELADYDPTSGKLIVRHGKGGKERTAYLVNGADQAMADWLSLRGSQEGALFEPINKGGNIQRRKMSAQTIYNLLSKRGREAGVKSFSPHDMRRTFVSDLLDAGADISTISKMAGHASVTTTARYDRRPEAAKQKAAGLLHVPYRGRLVR